MEQIFEKINTLFCEYLKASNLENTENVKLAIEEKIILAVWGSNKNYREYSVEVVQEVKKALASFGSGDFCSYILHILKCKINTDKESEYYEKKNGGIYITEYTLGKINNLKDFKKKEENQNLDTESFVKKAAEEFKMKESKIRDLLRIMNARRSGTETQNDEGENFASLENLPDSDKNSLDDELIEKEEKEGQGTLLPKIQEVWEKKSDPMLSELLTVYLLKEMGFDVEDIKNYTFVNKEICFTYPEKNPTYKEISQKHGAKDSSAGSQKLNRFLKNIKESLKNF